MKNSKSKLIFLLFLVCGLALMNYPLISEWVNSFHQSEIMDTYNASLSDDAAVEEALRSADAYNRKLQEESETLTDAFASDSENSAEYDAQLALDSEGIMGWIEIPSIHVSLPIYHGTDSRVLSRGAGHLEGSSLPVGGTGTHTVISAHSGLPEKLLFSDLDQLEIGDHFRLRVYGRELEYETDDIRVVTPDDTSYLAIDPDRDLVTLVTCTPYGVNSHRLFVSGHRTGLTEDGTAENSVAERGLGIRSVQTGLGLISAAVLAVSIKLLFFSGKRSGK